MLNIKNRVKKAPKFGLMGGCVVCVLCGLCDGVIAGNPGSLPLGGVGGPGPAPPGLLQAVSKRHCNRIRLIFPILREN